MGDNDQIAKLLGQLRNAMAERIVGLNRSLEAEEQSVTARVEQRKHLVWQLQLPNRLFTIYLEVEHFPVWAQTRPKHVCSLITEIDAREKRETRSYQIEKQVQYTLLPCRRPMTNFMPVRSNWRIKWKPLARD